jgi:hypothetical protein
VEDLTKIISPTLRTSDRVLKYPEVFISPIASADEYAYKATLLPALEAETVDHPVDEYAMIYLLIQYS